MLMARLERIDGEYILRIPRHEVVQHDLREGQLLAVALQPIDEFDIVGQTDSNRPADTWKLNENTQPYQSET